MRVRRSNMFHMQYGRLSSSSEDEKSFCINAFHENPTSRALSQLCFSLPKLKVKPDLSES